MGNDVESLAHTKWRCQHHIVFAPGQQHLKLSEKDIKKTLWIQGSGKALFLNTEPAAEISALAKGQSSFTQNVQVERRHIFAGPGCVLIKNDVQTPVELVFDSPVLAYRIGKTFHIGNRREKIAGICCSFGFVKGSV